MQPEISRRCNSCGAAIRDPAMFCPECGKSLAQSEQTKDGVTNQSESPPAVVSATESAPEPALASSTAKQGTIERARESLHRASSATREALADNVKRVEKIRQVSSTVIEEAHYDPSLRFVLVALAIFIVFIILLVLSKVMG